MPDDVKVAQEGGGGRRVDIVVGRACGPGGGRGYRSVGRGGAGVGRGGSC